MRAPLLLTLVLLWTSCLWAQAPEKEPNNDFTTADTIRIDIARSGSVESSVDPDDYYQTLLPVDGTLKVVVSGVNRASANGYLAFWMYDKRKTNGPQNGYYVQSSSVAAGASVSDTFTFYGLAADTFYFRLNTSGKFDYQISYSLADTSGNDTEPNNDFATALPIREGQVRQGHTGYILSLNTIDIGSENTVRDNYDYYRLLLPGNGSMKVQISVRNDDQIAEFAYLTVYDSKKQSVGYIRVGNKSLAPGTTLADSVVLSCLSSDTFYLAVNTDRASNYQLSYSIATAAVPTETEPNNTLPTAMSFQLSDTVRAAIGYTHQSVTDNTDYFVTRFGGKGRLRLYTRFVNTSSNTAYMQLSVYNDKKNAGQLTTLSIPAYGTIPAGGIYEDTILIDCVSSDSLWLRFTSNNCLSYSFRADYLDAASHASFDYNNTGNLYAFTNASRSADHYVWDFSNGLTSTDSMPPLISFIPGYYPVRLIASQAAHTCYLDTFSRNITVRGIAQYTPTSGGTGNVIFTVNGGGLSANTVLRLTQGNKVYIDSAAIASAQGNVYSCVVDLHNAPTGVYDVDILAGDSVYHYPGGFQLNAALDQLRAEAVGNDVVRYNIENPYKVRVYNDGNTVAGTTEVYLLLPTGVKATLLDSLLPNVTYNDVPSDSIPDSLFVLRSQGFPIDGVLRAYVINGIPQGGYKDLSFSFNLPLGAQAVYIVAKGPYDGSPWKSWGDECWKARMEFGLKAYTLVADGFITAVDDVVPFKAMETCALDLYKIILGKFSDQLLDGVTVGSKIESKTRVLNMIKTGGLTALHCAKAVGKVIPISAVVINAIELTISAYDLSMEFFVAVEAYANLRDKCNLAPITFFNKLINSRTSLDPNSITGPVGSKSKRFIGLNNKTLSYSIAFENQPSAALPARTVRITDTLDARTFDLKSFRLGSFGLGAKLYSLPSGSQHWVSDISISGNIGVRLNIAFDTLTGILQAIFQSIDPGTGMPPADPLAGFLPADIDAPQGQAFLTYSVNLKNGMTDGARVDNQATVLFDDNAPMTTNSWSNTIDMVSPSSQLTKASVLSDTTIMLYASGTDAASGINFYKLYLSVNGGAFGYLANVRDSARIYGQRDSTYAFYILAVDSAGNQESGKSTAEQTIHLKGDSSATDTTIVPPPVTGQFSLNVAPNPFRGQAALSYYLPQDGPVLLRLFDYAGRELIRVVDDNETKGQHSRTLDLANRLPSGPYILRLETSTGVLVHRILYYR